MKHYKTNKTENQKEFTTSLADQQEAFADLQSI